MRGVCVWPLGLLMLCTGCGPVPLAVAEQQCIETAQLAQRPRGSIGVGANSRGEFGARFSIGVSSDFIQGRDPDQVYAACVQGKSGLYPSRPFSTLPDSRM